MLKVELYTAYVFKLRCICKTNWLDHPEFLELNIVYPNS
jgi:hypothetical protein